ncbi:DUF1003 domain-containing protein (plasmid) [Caballeronia sp. NK8]|nr:DUF1003 domain-containing protein [Caballeronia sp. NK8]
MQPVFSRTHGGALSGYCVVLTRIVAWLFKTLRARRKLECDADNSTLFIANMKVDQDDNSASDRDHLRFQLPYLHLTSAFGNDWFALKAEAFARFFGTPTFLLAQTLIVVVWIALNVMRVIHFDPYPFVLLNLAFSLQSAYAAPMILLAQTRQADRDKAFSDADARHREALALAAQRRDKALARQAAQIETLLRQNTELTALTRELAEQIAALVKDQVH